MMQNFNRFEDLGVNALKILETTYTVNQHGVLKIPRETITGMGLYPGDSVRVAYISEDSEVNTFREFLLTTGGVDSTKTGGQITVPHELLAQAGISDHADIQVICGAGAIILCADPILGAEDLSKILSALGVAADMISQLPTEPNDAIELLQNTFNMEGANDDE